jgi:hypothetical protein
VRAAVATAVLILASTPAEACHRFTIWRYPTPQRCVMALARAAPLPQVRIEVKPPIPLPSLVWTPAPAPIGDDLVRLLLIGGTR